jgi:hypothetical protein
MYIETKYQCCVLADGKLGDFRAVSEPSSCKPLKHCPRNRTMKRDCKS